MIGEIHHVKIVTNWVEKITILVPYPLELNATQLGHDQTCFSLAAQSAKVKCLNKSKKPFRYLKQYPKVISKTLMTLDIKNILYS